ncbi:dnaJ homolog subfamily C member 21 [Cephus cinctus]|uniref:DnaJ homolog subfamily C member 21 n=1 Tax=Cephus cinctus TaxID=211228 RepID=A0AAJ7BX53_CEPCN|nr:dnaJ homolog subfamily C member 21 [Cephus cinctus]
MKCHYEVLGVARNATEDDIKKSYRKLALRWHPDKNLSNPDEAKEQFQLVQQAWEVLSDPHERAWYDNHRDAILKGGIDDNYKDDSIDLFQYFSSGCFKGYGDDDKGFYTVYRTVFEKLAAEDAEFSKEGDSDEEVPGFGDSTSSYEDVVHQFYSYWQSYSTKRSFAWLDPYDIRDTPNRRVLRLVEKENKKVRDKAKRERNEQVRNLVAFVRKRDKRVQAHAQKLAEKAKENAKKAQERKRQQLLERQKQIKNSLVSEWSTFSNIETELKAIEANLAAEFGEELSSDSDINNDDEIEDTNTLYCVACNKIFKTHKAFTNHENSKKHKENLAAMKSSMVKDDEEFQSNSEEHDSDSKSESKEKAMEDLKAQGVKLATDHGIPDFLMYPQNEPSNNDDIVTSDEEKVSDPDSDVITEQTETAGPVLVNPKLMKSLNGKSERDSDEELLSDEEEEKYVKKSKKQKKKKGKNIQKAVVEHDTDEEQDLADLDMGLSKKQRKKQQQQKVALDRIKQNDQEKAVKKMEDIQDEDDDDEKVHENFKANDDDNRGSENSHTDGIILEKSKGKKAKEARRAQKNSGENKGKLEKNKKDINIEEIRDVEHCCVTCKTEFSSKNKLFEHLKKTGHSVYLPSSTKSKKIVEKSTRRKGKLEKSSN